LGSRQKGRSDLKLASLRRVDRALVVSARQIAESLLGDDPCSRARRCWPTSSVSFVGEDEAAYLLKSCAAPTRSCQGSRGSEVTEACGHRGLRSQRPAVKQHRTTLSDVGACACDRRH